MIMSCRQAREMRGKAKESENKSKHIFTAPCVHFTKISKEEEKKA
jgi:hypothetical protein